jgi:tellurite resistance protein
MPETDAFVALPDAPPAQWQAAIQAALTEDGDFVARLRHGAAESVAETPTDVETARMFQTLLEVGYLVASADGFAASERESLAKLLETVTGAAVDHATMTLHFLDLDEAVEQLGRRERLARVAADLPDVTASEEAVRLAALVALADGRISGAELAVLVELGEHANVTAARIRELVYAAADRVKGHLA